MRSNSLVHVRFVISFSTPFFVHFFSALLCMTNDGACAHFCKCVFVYCCCMFHTFFFFHDSATWQGTAVWDQSRLIFAVVYFGRQSEKGKEKEPHRRKDKKQVNSDDLCATLIVLQARARLLWKRGIRRLQKGIKLLGGQGKKTTTEKQTLLTLIFMRRSIISMIFVIIIFFFAPRKNAGDVFNKSGNTRSARCPL